jgi:subtilisin
MARRNEETVTPAAVTQRDDQYLVAPVPADLLPMGVEPFDLGALKGRLEADGEVELVKTIAPRGVVSTMSAGAPGAQEVVVARMPAGHAEALERIPHLIVEPDAPLRFGESLPAPVAPTPPPLSPFSAELKVTIVVQGKDGTPLPEAQVMVFGRLWPVAGTTDQGGKVTLSLFGEGPDTLVALLVNPKSEYWSAYIERPLLSDGEEHLVTVSPLGDRFPGFPGKELTGWGVKAMNVDSLPPGFRGQGVKVGVVDSGAAGGHVDLGQVRAGFNLTAEPPSTEGWNTDLLGHGSHCSGVIAATSNNRGIVGVAPEAEVSMYKIFPGGRASSLIEALQRCVDDRVDVISLSLGSDERSELVDHKIAMAKELGIGCIIAAGNSGGPVQFPAGSGNSIAVAAIGKQGEYPDDSYHATQVWPTGKVSPEGFFSAKFTCFGPQVDVCAPGVAIVSSVPADNWAAMDGTSMATPHVAGLAALILAHHGDFKGPYGARNSARVDRLFEIIKGSAVPLDLGDPLRTGSGLPSAVKALAGEVATAPAAPAPAALAPASAPPAAATPVAAPTHPTPAPLVPPNGPAAQTAATGGSAPAGSATAGPPVDQPGSGVGQLRGLMEGARLVQPAESPGAPATPATPDPSAARGIEALRELLDHAGI